MSYIIMKITYRKKTRFEIENIDQLEILLKNIKISKYFISFRKEYYNEISNWIQSIDKIPFKKLKKEIFNKWFKSKTNFEINWWLDRGYTEDESKIEVHNRQSRFSKKTNKKPEHFNTKIEFYLKKGYSKENAILKLKERQSCFSRKKMIEKFGEKVGNKMVDERNVKWIDTLKKNNNWNEISYKKGNNGLNRYKTFFEIIGLYGDLKGRKYFAKRYWNIEINSIQEFEDYQLFLNKKRTLLFYDKNYRIEILKDQNFKCGKCSISNKESLFHLHHIDYNKKNDKRNNLIFLCHSCHAKTVNIKNKQNIIKEYFEINRKYTKND